MVGAHIISISQLTSLTKLITNIKNIRQIPFQLYTMYTCGVYEKKAARLHKNTNESKHVLAKREAKQINGMHIIIIMVAMASFPSFAIHKSVIVFGL